jgi:HAD superfamily hydrolase (TIGR01662 family)
MRLSTEADRNDEQSIGVLHAAFDAGITLVDTADAYCLDDSETGHNERLIARALSTWRGDRSAIAVATKGGMTRPDGRWEVDGRAAHLRAACERSRRALGVDRIALYQLHAVDPRTPLGTSVRALAALQRDGLIEAIGLSNVTVSQIEEARRIAAIDAIQVELSVWHDEHLLSGVAEYCVAHGLTLLAHRPLGGRRSRARTASDPTLTAVASRHDATPFEVALAWLMDLAGVIVPLPGATQVETVRSAARARTIELTGEDRDALDARFPAGRILRQGRAATRGASLRGDAEVVIVMGVPAAGKTTLARKLEAEGFVRLNRDEAGGSLRGLIPDLDGALASGATRVVLDNTYASRKSRAEVIEAAFARGVRVRCLWLSTAVEDAQFNAAWRLVERYGRLPDEAELKRLRKRDANAFLPSAQFRYQRELEPPDPSEGFSGIDTIAFERVRDPGFVHRAVLVWCDGVLMRSRSGRRVPATPEDLEVDAARADVLRRYREQGYAILGLTWQPEIADGSQSRESVAAVFAALNERTGVTIDVEVCPHAAGPPRCWCRKPLPGLGVLFIHRYKLDPAQCVYVGDGPQDPGFARRLGMPYRDATGFFEAASEDR